GAPAELAAFVGRRLSGRRELLPAPLRPELRHLERRLLPVEGFRRPVRAGVAPAARGAAYRDLPADGAARPRLCALDPERAPRAQPAPAALGARLAQAPVPA